MIILSSLSSFLLGVVALAINSYFATKYGNNSSILIFPVTCMALAIILAFCSGEMRGRKQQQKDMIEAMNKQQEVIVAQMNEIDAKYRAKASAEGR